MNIIRFSRNVMMNEPKTTDGLPKTLIPAGVSLLVAGALFAAVLLIHPHIGDDDGLLKVWCLLVIAAVVSVFLGIGFAIAFIKRRVILRENEDLRSRREGRDDYISRYG